MTEYIIGLLQGLAIAVLVWLGCSTPCSAGTLDFFASGEVNNNLDSATDWQFANEKMRGSGLVKIGVIKELPQHWEMSVYVYHESVHSKGNGFLNDTAAASLDYGQNGIGFSLIYRAPLF